MTFEGSRVRASRILSIEGSVTNQGKILHIVQDRPLNSPVVSTTTLPERDPEFHCYQICA